MKLIRLFFLLTATALTVGSSWAEIPDPFLDPVIRQINERHDKAVQGDKAETKALVTDLEKLTAEQPQNQLLKAYLGSAYTLRGRDIGFGPKAYSNLKNGLKTLDAAVEAEPQNAAVRFIRAINNFSLPAFCNRRDNAREDFRLLLAQLEKPHPEFQLSTETTQAIYYYAGISYRQLKDNAQARVTWTRGRQLAPDSPLGQKIQAELTKLKS
jgi:hypothetical protein